MAPLKGIDDATMALPKRHFKNTDSRFDSHNMLHEMARTRTKYGFILFYIWHHA